MRFKLKVVICLFLVFFVAGLPCFVVEAEPSVSLSFYKDNGYGFGGDIGGVWTVTAEVSSDVEHVEFYLDDQLQVNDTEAPFSWQFDTVNYATGPHTIRAVAFDALGENATAEVGRNFQEASTGTVTAVILVVVVVIVVAVVGFVLYRSRREKIR